MVAAVHPRAREAGIPVGLNHSFRVTAGLFRLVGPSTLSPGRTDLMRGTGMRAVVSASFETA
jgi:hypothetical protein